MTDTTRQRLDQVSAQISLVQTLLTSPPSFSLDERDIFGLYTLLDDWRSHIDAAITPSAEGEA